VSKLEPFRPLIGPAIPLGLKNVDTDVIISFEHLKVLTRAGLGQFAFAALRYQPDGAEIADAIFHQQRYRGAQILIARENFGCGSSREHAVWAIKEMGIRAVIATSFADIFAGNATKNGVLVVALPSDVIDILLAVAPSQDIGIDLEAQTVCAGHRGEFPFEIDEFRKACLLEGRDEIALAEQFEEQIASYEAQLITDRSWVLPRSYSPA
jgi:3-isopropylmalate/(R)-2-methylmalate dehydratase small subunit